MIFIILPTFNEEENIASLMESIDYAMKENALGYRIVLVNDGSSDKTAKVVKSLQKKIPVTLINHQKNEGLGETIKTGLINSIKLAKERDIIVTMDADNTHCPGLVVRMVRAIREGSDVVIASRYQRDSRVKGVKLNRIFLSKMANILFKVLFPIKGIKDYTSGYRAFKKEILNQAFSTYGDKFISESGFSCTVDILLKLRPLDCVMMEVPLILRYDTKKGQSKMDIRKTIVNTLKLTGKRLFKKNDRGPAS